MTQLRRYEDKVVVVTGAAGGLGRAFAMGFAAEGAHVVVGDLNSSGLEETVALIAEAGSSATAHVVDLGCEASIQDFARMIVANHASVDVLINNAGLAYGHISETFGGASQEQWLRYLSVNCVGQVLLADQLRPAIAKACAEGRQGVIINQSSMSSFSPSTIYGVTKATLNAITFGMAQDFGVDGIRVLAIAPGLIETPANRAGLSAELYDWVQGQQVLKKEKGSPADIVALGLFLASADARFMTADVISCDAGNSLRGWRN
jgi:NAD(P)-dependent dehydrogenase (short-subunit alcohol dehydrogenase family)